MNAQNSRILIVEDEEPLSLLLRYNLESEGYEVETVGRGDDADTRLRERAPDLVVLDWMLRTVGHRIVPPAAVTAGDEVDPDHHADRARRGKRARAGLATGADDYIVKPFSVPELIARIRALLRRASPERLADVLTLGEIELDRVKKRVSRAGRDVDLGPTEFGCWNS